jgi:hypothetical protein
MVNKIIRFLIMTLTLFLGVSMVSAAVNVLDVTMTEDIYESVTYDPLGSTSGNFSDTGEVQTYTPTGTLLIENNHPTDSVNDIILNLSGYNNIYNFVLSTGRQSTFVESGDNVYITIPDLASGQSVSYTYSINESSFAPPLNFTSNYSNSRILAGNPITVQDNVQNRFSTCVYNITVVQDSGQIVEGSDVYNFTFSGLAGTDSANASIDGDSQGLNWNVSGLSCLNAGEQTEIYYDVATPSGTPVANTYTIANSTINYRTNTTASTLGLVSILSTIDQELNFDKYITDLIDDTNASWEVEGVVLSQSNITVNLTSVTFWVSQRNGTGTGFTNPGLIDNDTVSGSELLLSLTPNQLLNSTLTPWTNDGSEWGFNYTYAQSPIVWMDLTNEIVNDGIQLTNSSVSYGSNSVYIKQLYVATGYWLEITKNITRFGDNNYSIDITVMNLGSSRTPANQAVIVYNFLPNTFNLTSPFAYSSSTWYITDETNDTLNDVEYNGTMFQFAITETNVFNSSLDIWGGASNANNTWTLSYNVTGDGNFAFEDLFLTGVDPLNVGEFGGTKALSVENIYKVLSAKGEYLLMGAAAVVGVLLLLT